MGSEVAIRNPDEAFSNGTWGFELLTLRQATEHHRRHDHDGRSPPVLSDIDACHGLIRSFVRQVWSSPRTPPMLMSSSCDDRCAMPCGCARARTEAEAVV